MRASLANTARRIARVHPGDAVATELLVVVARAAEAGVRQWAAPCGVEVDHTATDEEGRDAVSLRLHQVHVLDGRVGQSVSEEVVATWVGALQYRPGVRIISFTSRSLSQSTWRVVLARDERTPLEVVLVPEGQAPQETRSRAARRLGRPASELRLVDSLSWQLRTSYSRFASTCVVVVLLLAMAATVALALPRGRSTALLTGALLLVTSGLVFLVKDQGARAIGTQLAVLLGGLAGVSYAACRWAYYVYYDALGTTPEWVGLDYRSILSDQPFFVFVVVLVVLTVVLSCYALVKAVLRFPSSQQQKVAASSVLVLFIVTLTAFLPLLSIGKDAGRAADAVRAGGSPSTRGAFLWPDPRRVALAAASSGAATAAQAAYPATLAGADLRLLGGEPTVWWILDSVTGATFPLPKATTPLLLAPVGVDRLVVITSRDPGPARVVLAPDRPSEVALINETGATCTAAPGDYRTRQDGQMTLVDVRVALGHRVDVRMSCLRPADLLPVPRTLELRAGQE